MHSIYKKMKSYNAIKICDNKNTFFMYVLRLKKSNACIYYKWYVISEIFLPLKDT